MTTLGLELDDNLPDGWTPLEAIVTAKCLDTNGNVQTFHSATPTLSTYEAVGLLRWTQLVLEDALLGDEQAE
jgi:hypothetical protein